MGPAQEADVRGFLLELTLKNFFLDVGLPKKVRDSHDNEGFLRKLREKIAHKEQILDYSGKKPNKMPVCEIYVLGIAGKIPLEEECKRCIVNDERCEKYSALFFPKP